MGKVGEKETSMYQFSTMKAKPTTATRAIREIKGWK